MIYKIKVFFVVNIIVIITAILAYLIGSIPTGYIIARLKGIQDIRQHGSGNIGATNVSRLLGLHYFFFIFFLDASKAFLFICAIKPYFPDEYLYCFAIIVLLGNTCSLFLNGRGGKGVATLFGLLSALNLTAVGALLAMWSASMVMTKTVGISSVMAMLTLPLYALIYTDYSFFICACVVSAWVIWLHRSNIDTYWKSWCAKQ